MNSLSNDPLSTLSNFLQATPRLAKWLALSLHELSARLYRLSNRLRLLAWKLDPPIYVPVPERVRFQASHFPLDEERRRRARWLLRSRRGEYLTWAEREVLTSAVSRGMEFKIERLDAILQNHHWRSFVEAAA